MDISNSCDRLRLRLIFLTGFSHVHRLYASHRMIGLVCLLCASDTSGCEVRRTPRSALECLNVRVQRYMSVAIIRLTERQPTARTPLMPVNCSTDTSEQPENEYFGSGGSSTQSIGIYATFKAACEAARKSVGRGTSGMYKKYKEGKTEDDTLESDSESDSEKDDDDSDNESGANYSDDEEDDDVEDEEDDDERNREDFCIQTYYDRGK